MQTPQADAVRETGINVGLKNGILLVGHGTRDQLGTEEFLKLGRLLADRCKQELESTCVEVGLLEFQQPTIEQAWERLRDAEVDRVLVAPLLLFAAGHAKSDIPEIIAKCQSTEDTATEDTATEDTATEDTETNDAVLDDAGLDDSAIDDAAPMDLVSMQQSRPLSRHPAIMDLVQRRIEASIVSSEHDRSDIAVVLVGRGSYDPCARSDMLVLSEIIKRRINVGETTTAFYAMAEPKLPDVLDQLAASNRFRCIIVHPHLLFHGRLYQSISRQTDEAAQKYPAVRFITSDYLGAEPEVAKATLDRVTALLSD